MIVVAVGPGGNIIACSGNASRVQREAGDIAYVLAAARFAHAHLAPTLILRMHVINILERNPRGRGSHGALAYGLRRGVFAYPMLP